jgi:uncharacterized protein
MATQLALVTGASSGIGFSLAKELANRGYDLVICAAGDRLAGAAEEIRASGTNVADVNADLATPEGVDKLWAELRNRGPLDIACLNAGVGVGGLFRDTDLGAELNMIRLNCLGTVQLAKYVVRSMTDRGRRHPLHCIHCRRDGRSTRGSLRGY